MKISLRNILLKSIPYLLSIAGGLMLFLLTKDNIQDADLADLINNIAASLLSIPLVFLLYDYSNYRISKQLNQTLAHNLTDKVNVLLLNLIMLLRKDLGMRGKMTFESLNKMSDIRVSKIAIKLKMGATSLDILNGFHKDLEDLIYSNAKSNVLSLEQVQALSGLARELLHLVNAHKFHHNKHDIAQHIENIIMHIIDWLDSDASASMHFQQLLGAAQIKSDAKLK